MPSPCHCAEPSHCHNLVGTLSRINGVFHDSWVHICLKCFSQCLLQKLGIRAPTKQALSGGFMCLYLHIYKQFCRVHWLQRLTLDLPAVLLPVVLAVASFLPAAWQVQHLAKQGNKNHLKSWWVRQTLHKLIQASSASLCILAASHKSTGVCSAVSGEWDRGG